MVSSRDKDPTRGADALQDGGRQQGRAETKSTANTLLARSKTHACHDKSIAREPGDPQLALPEMAPASSCEKPDEGISRSRRQGKSDDFIVPKKSANNTGTASRRHVAERMEERRSAKGNSGWFTPTGLGAGTMVGKMGCDESVPKHEEIPRNDPRTSSDSPIC